VPVLVHLREARSAQGLENLVIDHFRAKGLERAPFKTFWHLLTQGFIVLILDGFDEMVIRTIARTTLEHLEELNRAAAGRAKCCLPAAPIISAIMKKKNA